VVPMDHLEDKRLVDDAGDKKDSWEDSEDAPPASPTSPRRTSGLTVDDYLNMIGDMGPYQRRHYLLVASAWIACSWCTLNMVFTNRRPEWRYYGGANLTANLSASFERQVEEGALPCGKDFEIVNPEYTLQAEWGLYCEHEWKAGLLNSLYFVGFGIGAATLGALADSIGRKKAFCMAAIISSAGCVLSGMVDDWRLFGALRLCTGIGIGGFGIVCYVYTSESIGVSWQAIQGVGQAGIFSMANALLAVLAMYIPGWRALTVVTGLTPLFWVSLWWITPESPRWLQQQGRLEEANSIMKEIERVNHAPPKEASSLPAGAVLAPPCTDEGQGTDSPGDLFEFPMLTRVVIMLYVWFANSFVYYGLSLNSGNLGGSLYFNFALGSIIEMLSFPIGIYLTDKKGRRPTMVGCMVLSGIGCTACLFLPTGFLTTCAAMLGKFGIAASFAIIFVYASELFPTTLRSLAMGMSSTSARVGGVLAPQVVLLVSISEALPLLVFGIVAFTAGLSMLPLPETLGKPLPDTISDCLEEPGTNVELDTIST